MDRFTRTRIPARYSRYRYNTLDLHVLENVRTSLALYLPPSSLLQLKYLSFVGSTMVDKAGRPCLSRASMRPWPRPLPLALTQEASWAQITPPLFDFSVYVYVRTYIQWASIVGRAVTWKQQQLDYIFF